NALRAELGLLRVQQKEKEILIDSQLKEIYSTLEHPASYIKRNIKELASDKDVRTDLFMIGLNFAVSYLGEKLTKSAAIKDLILNLFRKRSAKKEAEEQESEESPD